MGEWNKIVFIPFLSMSLCSVCRPKIRLKCHLKRENKLGSEAIKHRANIGREPCKHLPLEPTYDARDVPIRVWLFVYVLANKVI